jgi:putative oxidoreductase
MRSVRIVDPTQRAAEISAVTLLRVVVGVIMIAHGWQKLMDYGGWHAQVVQLGIPVPDVTAALGLAGELLGGAGLLLGCLTRIAAFGVFATMAVAILSVHLRNGLLMQNNGFEFPLVLLCSALYFLAAGAGPISIDALIGLGARRRAQLDQRAYEEDILRGQRVSTGAPRHAAPVHDDEGERFGSSKERLGRHEPPARH